MRDLRRLLRPRSIAVLGSGWARNVIEQCAKMGFDGPVWPVHPTREEIAGVRCYPSLAALPGVPDATFIGVNRHATLDVVAELAAMGAGGATCFASGWEEAGEAGLQAQLVAAAGEMPILGPNCYGVINYLDGALLWPDQHGGVRVDRGVALLSQSSNIVINLTMQARGLPVAYVACLGNAAQVGLAELAGALLADERVTALGMYVEGIDDAAAFADLAERARAAGKGIVCIKSGKTELSRTAAWRGGGGQPGRVDRDAEDLPSVWAADRAAAVFAVLLGRRGGACGRSGRALRAGVSGAVTRAARPVGRNSGADRGHRQPLGLPHVHLGRRAAHHGGLYHHAGGL
jgi:acyl-CoA synthetase (NDP forming)